MDAAVRARPRVPVRRDQRLHAHRDVHRVHFRAGHGRLESDHRLHGAVQSRTWQFHGGGCVHGRHSHGRSSGAVLARVHRVRRGGCSARRAGRTRVAAPARSLLFDLHVMRGLHHVSRHREMGRTHAWCRGHHRYSGAVGFRSGVVRESACALLPRVRVSGTRRVADASHRRLAAWPHFHGNPE